MRRPLTCHNCGRNNGVHIKGFNTGASTCMCTYTDVIASNKQKWSEMWGFRTLGMSLLLIDLKAAASSWGHACSLHSDARKGDHVMRSEHWTSCWKKQWWGIFQGKNNIEKRVATATFRMCVYGAKIQWKALNAVKGIKGPWTDLLSWSQRCKLSFTQAETVNSCSFMLVGAFTLTDNRYYFLNWVVP